MYNRSIDVDFGLDARTRWFDPIDRAGGASLMYHTAVLSTAGNALYETTTTSKSFQGVIDYMLRVAL